MLLSTSNPVLLTCSIGKGKETATVIDFKSLSVTHAPMRREGIFAGRWFEYMLELIK